MHKKKNKRGIIVGVGLILLLVSAIYGRDKLASRLTHLYFQIRHLSAKSMTYESRIETITFNAPTLHNIKKTIKVYLPKDYYVEANKKFPVLYLLHGFYGDNSDWLINGQIQSKLDQQIESGVIQPLIVAFPDGNGPVVADSEFVNATKVDQLVETYIVDDVVEKVDATYRTIKNRDSRAIGGVSSGGYGAVNIAFHHNDKFGVALSLSGFFINKEGVLAKLFGKDQTAMQRNNPLEYVSNLHLDPKTCVYLMVAENDPVNFKDDNAKMAKILEEKHTPVKLTVAPGSHGWVLWAEDVIPALQYENRCLKYQ